MNPSSRGAIVYEPEGAWGEDIATFALFRLPVIGAVDPSGLKHDKLDPKRVVQYRMDGTQWILATQGGTFKTLMYLAGHGSSTAGATAATPTETLLGKVFGNITPAVSPGSTFTGAGTAAAPTTTIANGVLAGALIRAGVLGDARGNGQAYAVSTHAASTLNLLTALAAVPSAADVLFSMMMLYPTDNPLAAPVASLRFLLQGANLQYECHGVFPTAIALSQLKTGGNMIPTIEVTWQVSWWRYRDNSIVFPSTVATDTYQPGPNAAGSLFVADVGTNARLNNTYAARDFSIDWKLGMIPLEGPGGVSPFQTVIGARRDSDEITWSFTVDADATTNAPVLPSWATSATPKHALMTLSPVAGKSVSFYAPNLCADTVPIQMNDGGINRLKFTGKAYTGPDLTNDLTRSATRVGLS